MASNDAPRVIIPSSSAGTDNDSPHALELKIDEQTLMEYDDRDSAKAGLDSPDQRPAESGSPAGSPFVETSPHLGDATSRWPMIVEPLLSPRLLGTTTWGPVVEMVENAGRFSFLIVCPFLVRELGSGGNVRGPLDSMPLTRRHLVDRLSRISGRRESAASETAGKALQIIESIPEEHDINVADEGKLTFDHLDRHYPPGSTVYRRDDGGWRAYRVDRTERPGGPGTDLHVHAFYLDFDESGMRLVPHSALLVAPSYPSARKVGSLELVPGWYIQETSRGIVDHLSSRGKRYWLCGGKPRCFEYRGNAWPVPLGAQPPRVMVDYTTPSKHQTADRPNHVRRCAICVAEEAEFGPYPLVGRDHDSEICIRPGLVSEGDQEYRIEQDSTSLFRYCPAKTWAFSLTYRSWREVRVTDLHDVMYPDVSQTKLYVLPNVEELLESLLESYISEIKTAPLNLPRKPGGRNVLLQGNPGSGKTFIVEYLADKYKVPLYTVNCACLGTDPGVLETRLGEVLRSAANWGMVLLLDDVTLFLRDQDPSQSLLNSVFRFQLAQSRALVFMTAVSLRTPDDKFLSHVGVALWLQGLSSKPHCQRLLWESAIRSLSCESKSDTELNKMLDELLTSKPVQHMDGRQIHACVRAAVALARQRDRAINSSHIGEVIALAEEFRKSARGKGPHSPVGVMSVERKSSGQGVQ
ncbi:uncharacterized protein B0T15DRAFT_490283 [Chaetomium strumarium]|uniref:AAA+ ATPase domain-containing protein n=1 Tax=Chaetomium strumarium TaxID=1170767 RepID=A0AAJ0H502_9PEZI|nr:hypothetical protein B0T15DRAFT_490283 [Chaetomium strumarium]